MNDVSRGGWSRHHVIIATKYRCTATTASASRPMTMPSARHTLITVQLVALRERPRARDVEDVGVAADVLGERRVRARHLDDLHRRGVKHALPGLALHLDALDAAVGA